MGIVLCFFLLVVLICFILVVFRVCGSCGVIIWWFVLSGFIILRRLVWVSSFIRVSIGIRSLVVVFWWFCGFLVRGRILWSVCYISFCMWMKMMCRWCCISVWWWVWSSMSRC